MAAPEDSTREGRSETLAAFGIAGLDEVLQGGLRRERIYLVEGASGAGKTTLGLQFLIEGVRRGERGLYVGLAETPEELAEVAASHGWSLDGIAVADLIPRSAGVVEDEAYSLFPSSEVELHASLQQMQEILAREGPERVVIDPLSAVRLLAADPAKYRQHLQTLREILKQRRCTVLLLDDTDSGQGFQPRSLAHGILSLERQARDYGPDRRRLRVTKYRAVAVPEGYHDLRILTGGLEVYPRQLAEPRGMHAASVLPTGLAPLDALLGGGLDEGASLLVAGAAGTGKSSLAMAFSRAALDRGEGVAYFLFDESRRAFVDRNRGIGLLSDDDLESGLLSADKVEPSEMTPGQLACRIRLAASSRPLRMVVIDSLSGYLHAMGDARFLDLHLHQLLSYLGGQGIITVLVLTHHGMLGEVAAPVDLSYISDTAVVLRFFEAEGRVRRAIAVQKRRVGPHEHSIRELRITGEGIDIGEPLRAFEGILSGRPRYLGPRAELLHREGG